MKVLIVFRRKEGEHWEIVKSIEEKLKKKGYHVDILSREEDLDIYSLSASMGSLKEIIKKKDQENNYDIIYTQDWSIAFPLLIPNRILEDKHYCFFHNVQEGGESRVLQRIVGNMLKNKLLVRTEELKKQFPKAIFSPDGVSEEIFK